MTAADWASLIAGTGLLLMAVATFSFVTQAAMESRLRVFVRRGPIAQPMSLRRAKKESRVLFVEQLNQKLRKANFGKKLQHDLVRAGLHVEASRFMLIQISITGTAFLLVWYLADSIPDFEGFGAVLIGALAAGMAWFIPMAALGFMEAQRLKKFERQLPPTIDSMAGALQAGSSLPQAMEMASREVAAPVGEELAIAVREMAVGVPMQDAFGNMLDRVRSLDLDMLISAIIIQHRVGGNLSQILRTISHTIRERMRIRGEIAILTAQQRLSAWIVGALPLVIIGALFFLAPDYIGKLFQPGIARLLLAMGGFGMLAGMYALKKISEIDV